SSVNMFYLLRVQEIVRIPVGQGSQLFIRTNEIPPSVNVAIDKQQGLSCTITFGKEIDESRNYICQ
ncbi:hypothetical protein FSF62_020405, partial [Escherichia coli]|nr:hypothetical protein [Escherichia coli]MBC0418045.1 hypothetical protein [Escherichia coli]